MSDSFLFKLQGVSKIRTSGPGYVLDIPQLIIKPGDKIAITGPSGSGKSTALDILGMTLQPDQTDQFLLQVDGQEINVAQCWRARQQDRLAYLRLRYLGYVMQAGGLLPYLTVRQNMLITADVNNLPQREKHVQELASALNIERLLEAMPSQLSIGERQRVAIGRALASRPAVIMADEPTAALDPYHAQAVLDMFLAGVQTLGVTLIMVTHSQDIVKNHMLREIHIAVEQQADGLSRAILKA